MSQWSWPSQSSFYNLGYRVFGSYEACPPSSSTSLPTNPQPLRYGRRWWAGAPGGQKPFSLRICELAFKDRLTSASKLMRPRPATKTAISSSMLMLLHIRWSQQQRWQYSWPWSEQNMKSFTTMFSPNIASGLCESLNGWWGSETMKPKPGSVTMVGG